VKIDAKGLHYRELNARIHDAVSQGVEEIDVVNVLGHRYIGTGLDREVTLNIYGTPGSDLGAFMDGPKINVFGSGLRTISEIP
jgi:glutamate synthase domain-containing protein 3